MVSVPQNRDGVLDSTTSCEKAAVINLDSNCGIDNKNDGAKRSREKSFGPSANEAANGSIKNIANPTASIECIRKLTKSTKKVPRFSDISTKRNHMRENRQTIQPK